MLFLCKAVIHEVPADTERDISHESQTDTKLCVCMHGVQYSSDQEPHPCLMLNASTFGIMSECLVN